MKPETYYAVGSLEQEHEVDVLGRRVPLPLTWADGMIGVMPVFKNKKSAQKYTGKGFIVFRVSIDAAD